MSLNRVEVQIVALFHSFYAIENENAVLQFVLSFTLFDIYSNKGN
jgi:hypothetical protein